MVDGRHEDEEAAGERDVAGDARALLGDGLLGDLHEDFLARLEQVADGGQVHGLGRGAVGSATLAAAGAASTTFAMAISTSATAFSAAFAVARRRDAVGCDGLFAGLFLFVDVGFEFAGSKFFFSFVGFCFFRFRDGGFIRETLVDMLFADKSPTALDCSERFFFEVFGVVFVAVCVNRLEVVFVFVDYFFFEDACAGSEAEELVGNLGGLLVMVGRFVVFLGQELRD